MEKFYSNAFQKFVRNNLHAHNLTKNYHFRLADKNVVN